LIHDIREGAPVFFHTRWAMSYLCGPLTRKQVRKLEKGQGDKKTRRRRDQEAGGGEDRESREASGRKDEGLADLMAEPPTLPSEVPQVFLPPTVTFEWALRGYEERGGGAVLAQERRLVYNPHLLALGMVRMLDRARDVDHQETVARLVQPGEGLARVDWDEGQAVVSEDDLSSRPMGEGVYAPVDSTLARSRDLKRLETDFADYLYHNVSITIWHNPALKLYGTVGESRRDFLVRCQEEARTKRDAELKKSRASMDTRIARVQEKLRREKRELTADQAELDARKREEVLNLGESALNLFTGRRSSAMLSRASRKRTMTQKANADVEESVDAIKDLEEQLKTLEAEWEGVADDINIRWADTLEEIEEIEIGPRRADVIVEFCGLAWVPAWQVTLEDGRRVDLPAREPAGQTE
jgi:hypothetical protein